MVDFSQIGDRAINLVEEMMKKLRKFAQRSEKPQGILDKLKSMAAKVTKWPRRRKLNNSISTMKEYDEAISLLESSELSDEERFNLIKVLRNFIEQTNTTYDATLSSQDLTEDEKKKLQAEKDEILKALNAKLDKALGLEPTQASEQTIASNNPTVNPIESKQEENNVEESVGIKVIDAPSRVFAARQPDIKKVEEVDYSKLTDEELKAKLAEFENEYNYRVHQENGLIEHDDDLIGEMKKVKDELERRKPEIKVEEVDYSKLTNEELKAKLAEFENEYNYRVHQENGLIEHDDDLIGNMKKVKDELEKREDKNEKKAEIKNETVDLSYSKFDSYEEFLIAYCKAERKPEDVAKFLTDLYGHDIRPQGVPSRDEFIAERIKQIEKIRLDKQQEEIRNQKKTISEMKIKLGSAEEKSKDLERQYNEAKTRLEESRNDVITLTQNITDLEAEVANKEAKETALNTQVQTTTTSLTQAQDELYKQGRTISENLDEIKKLRQHIELVEKENEDLKLSIKEKDEDIAKSHAQLSSLMNNVTSQINAAKEEAEDKDSTLLNHYEEPKNKEASPEKKNEPKHMKKEKHLKREESGEPTIIVEEPTKEVKSIILPEKKTELKIERNLEGSESKADIKKPEESDDIKKAKMLRDVITAQMLDKEPELAESKGIKL